MLIKHGDIQIVKIIEDQNLEMNDETDKKLKLAKIEKEKEEKKQESN